MVKYNLGHLIQGDKQDVWGPIQDDEALVMFSLIRCMRLSNVLEIGGLSGYSARNFLEAVGPAGTVFTVDLLPLPSLAPNHRVIVKNALHLTNDDVDNRVMDVIFFDCHDMVQKDIFLKFQTSGIINDSTVLILHDTNLHFPPFHRQGQFVASEGGFAHQTVERDMVVWFQTLGYDTFHVHTKASVHSEDFPFRHGLTVCQKHKALFNS